MEATRTRDGEATQARILRAAAHSFAEKGMGRTSVSEIAAAAGVTKSLIHHHFGSKEGLWAAVKEQHFRGYFEAQMRMLESAASAELVESSVREYFGFLGRHPEFVRMIGWMLLEDVGEERFPLGEMLTREGVRKIRETQEAGELRADVHPFAILASFLALTEHWFLAKALHCKGLDPDDEIRDDAHYLEDMRRIFFEGILPRETPA